jgi:NAD-dependent deacetylase sirtuin 2
MDIPSDKIINVHGSLGAAACESCGAPMEMAEFCQLVSTHIKDIYGTDPGAPSESSPIPCPSCGKHTVKPTTVLFGSHLPTEFFEQSEIDLPETDLLIVAGTSLVVSPANTLVYQVPDTTIRVVVNREQVGSNLGIQYNDDSHRDFFAQGSCDEIFLDLMDELNWLDTLSNDHFNDLPKSSAQLLRDRLGKKSS